MLSSEMKGINALNLEQFLPWCVDDASPKCRPRTKTRAAKSLLRKDFEQYLEQRRVRLARVEEDKVAHEEMDTQQEYRKQGPRGESRTRTRAGTRTRALMSLLACTLGQLLNHQEAMPFRTTGTGPV